MVDKHFSDEPGFKEHPPIRFFAGSPLVPANPKKYIWLKAWAAKLMGSQEQSKAT
jgi:hypothetical protein